MTDVLLASLRRAVAAAPEDLPLRLHLSELLVERGLGDEAVAHLGVVLAAEPGDVRARALMARAVGGPARAEQPGEPEKVDEPERPEESESARR